ANTGNVAVIACTSVVAVVIAWRLGATDRMDRSSAMRQRRSRIWPVVRLLYVALESVRHRQLDVDGARRDWTLETGSLELLEIACAHQLGERLVNQCLELAIVLPNHQRVRVGRIRLVEQLVVGGIFCIRPEARD